MFVGTWNVGGRAPDSGLNLRDCLTSSSSPPADIYILGFQEIVPLNSGNVLCAEDRGPAGEWLSVIRKALNYSDVVGVNLISFEKTVAAGEDSGGLGAWDGHRLVDSISVSVTLRGTSFCFVYTYLASGEKERDEARRNKDVMEILKKTKFSNYHSILCDSP